MDYVPFLIFLLYLYMYLLCDNKRYWIEIELNIGSSNIYSVSQQAIYQY